MIIIADQQADAPDQLPTIFHLEDPAGRVTAVFLNGADGPACQLLSPQGDVVGDLRLNVEGCAQLALFFQGQPRALIFLAPNGSPIATGFDDRGQVVFTFNPTE